jgi:Tfp pilus assembly protein PilN
MSAYIWQLAGRVTHGQRLGVELLRASNEPRNDMMGMLQRVLQTNV